MPAHNIRELPEEWVEYGVRFGTDQRLYFAEWRGGFTVHDARAMFFECQRLRCAELDLASMGAEVELMQRALEKAQKDTAFYRAQLKQESCMGWLPVPISRSS